MSKGQYFVAGFWNFRIDPLDHFGRTNLLYCVICNLLVSQKQQCKFIKLRSHKNKYLLIYWWSELSDIEKSLPLDVTVLSQTDKKKDEVYISNLINVPFRRLLQTRFAFEHLRARNFRDHLKWLTLVRTPELFRWRSIETLNKQGTKKLTLTSWAFFSMVEIKYSRVVVKGFIE